jgi:chromosome segregation protein
MRLTSLELTGFKSFPETTKIEFDEGITAIVGPNGSGKSNITDAIRWVLGEQSLSRLRGSRMADIVFSGTQSRRALGFTEVTISFDNADLVLPIDYKTVEITRRYYRSGESEYEINRTPCRLKDIVTLFMDTGIGRDGYSIVGQGKVDQILSGRTDERRQLFDEASGIVKFKARKNEALRKIEITDQNLLRLDDILTELRLRLGPLENQAKDARLFLEINRELKEKEIYHIHCQVKHFSEQLRALGDEAAAIKVKREKSAATVDAIRDENEQTGKRIDVLQDETDLLHKQHDEASAKLAEISASLSRLELDDEHRTNRLQALADEKAQLADRRRAVSSDLAERKSKRILLKATVDRYESELEAAKVHLQALLARHDEEMRRRQKVKANLDHCRDRLFDLKTKKVDLESERRVIKTQLDAAKTTAAELKSTLSRLTFQIEDAVDTLNAVSTEKEAFDAERQMQLDLLEQISVSLSEQEERRATLRTERDNALYRLKVLENLERTGEGFPQSVRRLQQEISRNPDLGEGWIGPFSSVIEVDDGFELAIETTLGPSAWHIVVDEQKTASRLIGWLKDRRAGRATFLPVGQMSAWPLAERDLRELRAMKGWLGTADTFVSADLSLQKIVTRLLGRTVIADTLENALAMFNSCGRKLRFVTLGGDVLHPGGSMAGGYDDKTGSGLISRRREKRDLEKMIKDLVQKLAALEQEILQTGEERRKLSLERSEGEKQGAEFTSKQAKATQDLAHLQDTAVNLSTRLEQAKLREEEFTAEEVKLKEQGEVLEAELMAAESEEERLREESSVDEQSLAGAEAALDDAREDVADLRVSLNSVLETIQAQDELEQRVKEDENAIERRLEAIACEEKSAQEKLVENAGLHEEMTVLQKTLELAMQQAKEEVSRLGEQRQALEVRRRELFSALEKEGEKAGYLTADYERCEASRIRVESRIDEQKSRLWEKYELTLETSQDFAKLDLEPTKAAKDVAKLYSELKKLGQINPVVIEELEEVKKRSDELERQYTDMVLSRRELGQVIRELDEAMTERFGDYFQKLSASFRQVFRELFNGGDAALELADSDDLLESDILIRAQPPGKRMQSLNPLSGGERSLTAIALVFAILRLRPSPFCIFDEIESSLDDANVLRFADYIRKYSADTQFVLVTHRKGTMEAADRLYGVTMQERGISSILSMSLEGE